MPAGLSVTAESSCPNCGAAAPGNYCSNCGAKQGVSTRVVSLESTVAEAIGKDRYRYYRTIVGLIFAPVTATIKLTLDESFKAYFPILFAVATAKAVAFFVTFPTILRDVFEREANPTTKDAIEVTRFIVHQYISLAVLFFISYFVYRAVSPNSRTPGQFVKFAAIAAIVFALIDIATGVLIYVGILALGPDIRDNQFDALYYGFDGLNRIVTLIFFAAVSRGFWQIGWLKALAVGIPLALVNWKVIEPYVQTVLGRMTH
jgi:hypothetical protein